MLLEHAVMIRRLKEEVLSDMLPEKDRQVVDVPCDQEVMKEVSWGAVWSQGWQRSLLVLLGKRQLYRKIEGIGLART